MNYQYCTLSYNDLEHVVSGFVEPEGIVMAQSRRLSAVTVPEHSVNLIPLTKQFCKDFIP